MTEERLAMVEKACRELAWARRDFERAAAAVASSQAYLEEARVQLQAAEKVMATAVKQLEQAHLEVVRERTQR